MRKKVLVADCHEEALIVLERMLEDAGFDTTTVWTAKDALRLMESELFDLVLVSEYLPDAEWEVLPKALHSGTARVPCTVMQPSAPEIRHVKALQALGVSEIVRKYAYQQVVDDEVPMFDTLDRQIESTQTAIPTKAERLVRICGCCCSFRGLVWLALCWNLVA